MLSHSLQYDEKTFLVLDKHYFFNGAIKELKFISKARIVYSCPDDGNSDSDAHSIFYLCSVVFFIFRKVKRVVNDSLSLQPCFDCFFFIV